MSFDIDKITNINSSINIAIFGAGSIGCYLGGQLINANCDVTFLGREKFKKDIEKKRTDFNSF